jgi:hypothetical protein
MSGGIDSDRWMSYLRDMLRILSPGGWCQMVEIYFNAQSDNGSLTESRCQCRAEHDEKTEILILPRPCIAGLVPELSAEYGADQRPPSSVASAKLDAAGRIRAGRDARLDIAPKRMVNRCVCTFPPAWFRYPVTTARGPTTTMTLTSQPN